MKTVVSVLGLVVVFWACGCGNETDTPVADGQGAAAESVQAGESGTAPTAPGATSPSNASPSKGSASDGRRMRVVRSDGRPSPLFQKVVVTNIKAAIYASSPGEDPNQINPWTIFYRLKTEDGKEEVANGSDTYWCVGDSNGKQLGFINKKFLTTWNTRFVLSPIAGNREDRFIAKRDKGGNFEHETGKGNRTWCFIREAPQEEKGDDTVYPIMAYQGQVRQEGEQGLDVEIDKLKNLGLEVVFVVESSQMMHTNYGTDTEEVTAAGSMKSLVSQWQTLLQNNEQLKGRVKLGLVEFQDDNQASDYVAKITVPLTENTEQVVKAVNGIEDPETTGKLPSQNDMWAQDAFAGLNAAISEVNWAENSSKHVIVIGCTMPQTESDGAQRNPISNRPHLYEQIMGPEGATLGGKLFKVFDYGYNSSNLTLNQLLDRAAPAGGDDYTQATARKLVHAINVGIDFKIFLKEKIFPDSTEEQFTSYLKIMDQIADADESTITALSNKIDGFASLLVWAYFKKAFKKSEEEASKVYRALATSNAGSKGLYLKCDTTRSSIQETVAILNKSVNNAFGVMANIMDIDSDDARLASGGNEQAMSSSIWKIVDANGDLVKDTGVVFGAATVRNSRGVKWAERRVLVGKDELDKLRSSLEAMYDGFKGMVRKAKRQDVGTVLAKLQAIAAGATTGQKFDANTSLQDAITDLPLRTPALQTTAKSLAVMSGPNFKSWLERIRAAQTRCKDLLDNKGGATWFQLNDLAPQSRFTVLKLSQLP